MSAAPKLAPSVDIPPRALAHLPAAPDRPLASVTVLCPPRELSGAGPLRLTSRGLVVVTAAVLALGAALVWLAALSAPSTGPVPVSGPVRVTVHAGDTLWSIATRVAPQRDPRAEIGELRGLNHLAGARLTPGQVLRVR
jgi:nucleoid-associated protein YgaU